MNGYITSSKIAPALYVSHKELLKRARKEKWPCVKYKGALFFFENRLPENVRMALSKQGGRETIMSNNSGLSQLTDKAREAAQNRSALIYEYGQSGLKPSDFCGAYNAGQIAPYLFETLGQVSDRTLYRWLREQKEAGTVGTQALAALAPKYGIKKSGAGVTLDPVQRSLLRQFWLKNTRPAMAHAWKQMLMSYPHKNCTYQTAARFLQSIPPAERDYYRLGKKKFEDLYLPYVEQNINLYKSLDLVVSDHHVLDCVVVYRGKLIRPWITTFQDYRSGKIVGFFPTVKPSSLSIIAAYYMCCIRYGVPKAALFDNGRDYRSKLINGYQTTAKQFTPEGIAEDVEVFFQGVLPALGTEVLFTKTYSAKSKGRQERYYRILGEYLSKDIGSYVGSDTTTKPEDADLMWRSINGMAKREDIPTWDYFIRAAAAMIEYINDTFTSQGKGMDGKTRSRVFEENLPEQIRHVAKEELQQALYRSEVHKCGRNGIKHHGIFYYHPALLQYTGQDVVIRNKIITDNEMPVYAVNGAFICNAVGDYFAEGANLSQAIKRVESIRKHSFLALAERGTNEVAIAAEQKIMLETAMNIYDDKLPSLESLLGEPEEAESLPMAAGAENISAKKNKYVSVLDARPEQILHMEVKNEFGN
ncbi:MAG: Mu transposase C-terminal domain-containing protein [Treponema sp.]|nr:Mu transposase C-terminal domain-containing protein [Treponema sp.]MCL2272423.1 Mu transposase C-terminal domain-containing protein [Treponema sp.]